MPTFWSQCKAHIIMSWGICFFLHSSLCTTGFILHKVACFLLQGVELADCWLVPSPSPRDPFFSLTSLV